MSAKACFPAFSHILSALRVIFLLSVFIYRHGGGFIWYYFHYSFILTRRYNTWNTKSGFERMIASSHQHDGDFARFTIILHANTDAILELFLSQHYAPCLFMPSELLRCRFISYANHMAHYYLLRRWQLGRYIAHQILIFSAFIFAFSQWGYILCYQSALFQIYDFAISFTFDASYY